MSSTAYYTWHSKVRSSKFVWLLLLVLLLWCFVSAGVVSVVVMIAAVLPDIVVVLGFVVVLWSSALDPVLLLYSDSDSLDPTCLFEQFLSCTLYSTVWFASYGC